MRIRAPYRLEPRPGGYTVVIPRPCNDCDASGIVARTRRHYPTTYAHCETCKGSGSTEARREVYARETTQPGETFGCRGFVIKGEPSPPFVYRTPALAAEAIVASFRRPWNHETTPRTDAEVIAAVTSFESPV